MRKSVLIVLSITLFILVFKNPFYLGFQDWDQHYAFAYANNLALIKYNQLPLWNPYHCGGISQVGNPQNNFFSPFYLPVFLFGPVIGFKFQFYIFMFAGLFGFYFLGRYLKISKTGSLLAAVIYAYSGLFIGPFASGMTVFFPLTLLPFFTLALFKALESQVYLKYSVISGCLLALIFLSGFHYI